MSSVYKECPPLPSRTHSHQAFLPITLVSCSCQNQEWPCSIDLSHLEHLTPCLSLLPEVLSNLGLGRSSFGPLHLQCPLLDLISTQMSVFLGIAFFNLSYFLFKCYFLTVVFFFIPFKDVYISPPPNSMYFPSLLYFLKQVFVVNYLFYISSLSTLSPKIISFWFIGLVNVYMLMTPKFLSSALVFLWG